MNEHSDWEHGHPELGQYSVFCGYCQLDELYEIVVGMCVCGIGVPAVGFAAVC